VNSIPWRWFVLVVFVLAPSRAEAHDLKAEVKTDVDPIRVEAGFDDGSPAQGAHGQVIDADGKVIASGVLDEKGIWLFAKPGPGKYRIVVEIAGHRDEVHLDVPESSHPVAVSRWRMDKDLGLAIGLLLLLGGTLGYAVLRNRRKTLPDVPNCG
jgi:hypothetical protein